MGVLYHVLFENVEKCHEKRLYTSAFLFCDIFYDIFYYQALGYVPISKDCLSTYEIWEAPDQRYDDNCVWKVTKAISSQTNWNNFYFRH